MEMSMEHIMTYNSIEITPKSLIIKNFSFNVSKLNILPISSNNLQLFKEL